MKKRQRWLAWFALLGMCFALNGQAAAKSIDNVDLNTPDGLIQSVTDDVMKTVKSDPSMQQGNLNKITKLVDEKVLPHADLEKSTRLVIGPYWRSATVEQRQQLIKQFKDLLFYTYSGAVAQIRDQQIRVLPLKIPEGANDVVVKTEIVNQGQAQSMTLDYRLIKTAAGWKVYDVSIAGVSVIANYRGQFKGIIAQRGLDGLLVELEQRNQRLTAGK